MCLYNCNRESGTNLGVDGLAADWATAATRGFSLLVGTVHGPESLEALLELGREAIIGFNLRREESVATRGGLGAQVRVGKGSTKRLHTWSRMKKKVVPAGCFS